MNTGCTMSNVFYLTLDNPLTSKKEKELSMNIVNVSMCLGMLFATLAVLIVDNLFWNS